eukprot:COSAG05_NODE_1137_length_5751_cov_9.852619_5_plen_290_part_00
MLLPCVSFLPPSPRSVPPSVPVGYGVWSPETIEQGEFVCQYVGEILTIEEAMARADTSYQFELEILPKTPPPPPPPAPGGPPGPSTTTTTTERNTSHQLQPSLLGGSSSSDPEGGGGAEVVAESSSATATGLWGSPPGPPPAAATGDGTAAAAAVAPTVAAAAAKKKWPEPRFMVDAKRKGNVARFINHCSERPNLFAQLVFCAGYVLHPPLPHARAPTSRSLPPRALRSTCAVLRCALSLSLPLSVSVCVRACVVWDHRCVCTTTGTSIRRCPRSRCLPRRGSSPSRS